MLMRTLILSIFTTLSVPSPTLAAELLIITGKETSEKKYIKKKIANIFLRERLINQHGERWIPVNLGSHHPLRKIFSETLLDQYPEELDNYWNIKYFQGISPPYVVDSQEAMLRFVTTTPNAIGYISSCFKNNNVKVIFRIALKSDKEQKCNDLKR
jgi:hypothetical protein